MFELLNGHADDGIRPLLVVSNTVPLENQSIQRVLAVNVLHGTRGEIALAEIARLLAPERRLLVIDWERGRERRFGPPDDVLYSAEEARDELAASGLAVERLDLGLPFHFALRAQRSTQPTLETSQRS